MTLAQIIAELELQLELLQQQRLQYQQKDAMSMAGTEENDKALQHKIELYATALDALRQI